MILPKWAFYVPPAIYFVYMVTIRGCLVVIFLDDVKMISNEDERRKDRDGKEWGDFKKKLGISVALLGLSALIFLDASSQLCKTVWP